MYNLMHVGLYINFILQQISAVGLLRYFISWSSRTSWNIRDTPSTLASVRLSVSLYDGTISMRTRLKNFHLITVCLVPVLLFIAHLLHCVSKTPYFVIFCNFNMLAPVRIKFDE